MATDLHWYDETLVLISGRDTLSGVAGVPGVAILRYLINAKDGAADPANNLRLRALFRDAGGTVWLGSGHEWADLGYLEVRFEAGGWNLNLSESAWQKLGADSPLRLPNIGSDQGVKLAFRLNAPPAALADAVEIALRVEDGTSDATSVGVAEAGVPGIYAGIRDGGQTLQVDGGDVIQNPGGADRDVQVQYSVWLAAGGVFALSQQLVTIPNAAAGKARYDLLSLPSAGSITPTRTAGSEVDVGSITADDKPALPAGDVALAYVYAGDSTAQPTVQDSDIENVWVASLYPFSSSGLVATIGLGPAAVVGNFIATNQVAQSASLTASDTNYIWLLTSGALQVTLTPDPPEDRALLLWEADTDGLGVTATRDRRSLTGLRLVELRFTWDGEVAVDDWRYAHLHSGRSGWLLPLGPVVASIGVQVAGTGLSGQTSWEVEVDTGGGFPGDSIFEAPPAIAYNAAELTDRTASLALFQIPAGARVRAKVSEVPSGAVTTNPQGASLSLWVAV